MDNAFGRSFVDIGNGFFESNFCSFHIIVGNSGANLLDEGPHGAFDVVVACGANSSLLNSLESRFVICHGFSSEKICLKIVFGYEDVFIASVPFLVKFKKS